MFNRVQQDQEKKDKLWEVAHTHRLPHAMVDKWSAAGHAANAVVFQLQL